MYWILISIGFIVLLSGLYGWFAKKEDPLKKNKFGWISYFGFALLYLGTILSLEPVLSQIPSVLIMVLSAVVFFFAAIIFLPYKKKK